MKKYIVRWKPRKGGKVIFRQEVTAPDTLTAQAMVGVPAQGEVVSVEEYVQDLWTPIAGALVKHLEDKAVSEGWRSLGD